MENIYTHTSATFTTANGETVSYEDIFESVRKSVEVYRKAGGRDLSVEELEDLFQDSVLKAIRYCKSFDPLKASAKTWASRIAQNAQRDAYKEHNRQAAIFVHAASSKKKDDDESIRSLKDTEGGCEADRKVESDEAMERIMNAISSLKENYQLIISLHLDGMTPKDMAEVIDCSASAAATLLFRARKALKKALGQSFLSNYGIAA